MSLLSELMPNIDTGIYTDNMHKKISEARYRDIDSFMRYKRIKSEYPNLKVNEFYGMKINDHNLHCEFMSFCISDAKKYMYVFTTESFIALFTLRDKYVFIPIYCNIRGHHHLMLLIIDNKDKKLFVFDPNNTVNYVTYIEHMIDKTLIKHKMTKEYKVIPIQRWNPYEHVLNRISSNSPICFGGYCVILCIIMSQALKINNRCIHETLGILASNKEALYSLMYTYSYYYFQFIKN